MRVAETAVLVGVTAAEAETEAVGDGHWHAAQYACKSACNHEPKPESQPDAQPLPLLEPKLLEPPSVEQQTRKAAPVHTMGVAVGVDAADTLGVAEEDGPTNDGTIELVKLGLTLIEIVVLLQLNKT